MSSRTIAILVALGAATFVTSASNAGVAKPGTTKTTSISFDGFCDGMAITVFSWHQAGDAHTGCSSRLGAGMEGKVKGIFPKALTIGENPPNDYSAVYLWNLQYPLHTGNTWSLYSTSDGINLVYQNTGTYTVLSKSAPSPHVGPPSNYPVGNNLVARGAAVPGTGVVNPKGAQITRISYCSSCFLTITVFPSHLAMIADSDGNIPGIGLGMEGEVIGVSPKDLTIEENYADTPGQVYLWNIQYPLANGNTWSIYTTANGVDFSYVTSGAYTIVGADAAVSPRQAPHVHRGGTPLATQQGHVFPR